MRFFLSYRHCFSIVIMFVLNRQFIHWKDIKKLSKFCSFTLIQQSCFEFPSIYVFFLVCYLFLKHVGCDQPSKNCLPLWSTHVFTPFNLQLSVLYFFTIVCLLCFSFGHCICLHLRLLVSHLVSTNFSQNMNIGIFTGVMTWD